MSVQIDASLLGPAAGAARATLPCEVCGGRFTELRRGRCWGCYTRWQEARTVGKGAACAVCDERRRSELRLIELHGRTHPLCHSCCGRISRLPAIPPTVAALRTSLRRDRRDGDRRNDGDDRRIFPRERRVGERRAPPRAGGPDGTDPHITLPDFEDIVIELADADLEAVEQTQVRDRAP